MPASDTPARPGAKYHLEKPALGVYVGDCRAVLGG